MRWSQRLAEAGVPGDRADVRLEAIAAVQHLGHRDRQIIYWRFFEECTQSEIGERLGVGQVQVSRLLKATLAQLRQHCDVDALSAPDHADDLVSGTG